MINTNDFEAIRKLAKEYRKTMPDDVMRLWAEDVVDLLKRLADEKGS